MLCCNDVSSDDNLLNVFVLLKVFLSNPDRYYTKARTVLDQYQHMPSFHGIREDCSVIVAELCVKLREQFKNKEVG